METIKLTPKAVACLDFFKGHPYYGNTYSQIILELTEEWMARDKAEFDFDKWIKENGNVIPD